VEVVLSGWVLISLDVVGPVEDGTEPLGGFILANSFWVLTKVNVLELINLREHILLEVSVVVRASCLDGTTAPPAAAGVASWTAFHWAGSPGSVRHGSHFHVFLDLTGPWPIIKTSIEDSVSALSARCGLPSGVVVLVTSRPGSVTTRFPHSLCEEGSNVRNSLFAGVFTTVTEEKFSVTVKAVELSDSCAEAFPSIGRVEFGESNLTSDVRLFKDGVKFRVTSAITRGLRAGSFWELTFEMAPFGLLAALIFGVDSTIVAVSPLVSEPSRLTAAESVSWRGPLESAAFTIASVPSFGWALCIGVDLRIIISRTITTSITAVKVATAILCAAARSNGVRVLAMGF